MGFLLPTALALAALALPIIIFYMLKLRRQPRRVSSLMLWEQVLADRQANAPWQKLKRHLLLLLQLLILALLVMALARPYFNVEARVQGNVVLLVDASASMQALEPTTDRLSQATAAAWDIINRLEADNTVTLIAVARNPRVLAAATTERNLLRNLLDTLAPTNTVADWQAALTLAAANAATMPNSTIVIISDGAGLAKQIDLQNFNLPTTPQFVPVGQTAQNQGITTMSLRDGLDGPELFVQVYNAAATAVTRLVDIDVNGQVFDARNLTIRPHAEESFTISDLPLEARQIQATLVGEDDLPADNVAWVIRQAAPTQILIVGTGNLFLERALALLPDVEIQRAPPQQPLPQQSFDMIIFDRTLPEILPDGNLFFIAPPASTEMFTVRGHFSQTRISRVVSDHPLLSYITLDDLHIAQAQTISPAPWMRPLVETEAGALLLAGEQDGRRVAVLTFDLFHSDWPLQIEFPIFMLNLTRWLVPGEILEQAPTLHPEQSYTIPSAAASQFYITTPSGERLPLTPQSNRPTTFNQTTELGVYQVEFADDNGQTSPLTEFAVNLLAVEESNLQPQAVNFVHSVDTSQGTEIEPQRGRWEWWWLLALAGLGVLFAEWWLYWRGEAR